MHSLTRLANAARPRTILAGGLAGLGVMAAVLGTAPSASASTAASGGAEIVTVASATSPSANQLRRPQAAWYAVPRTGGGNPGYVRIRAQANSGSAELGTIYAPNGAWCWHQETNCGDYVSGGSYKCYSSGTTYSDWLPVAASNGSRAYVARHCVIGTYK